MITRRASLFTALATTFALAGPACTPGVGSTSGHTPNPGGMPSPDDTPPADSLPGGADEDTPTAPTEPTGDPANTTADATTTGTGSTAPDATIATGYCGDGAQAPDEQCDDGEANSDFAYCTEQCVLNVCGDGLLLIGAELCDEGDANSDDFGSTCNTQCLPAERCGDGLLQTDAGEQCDFGNDNGTDEVDSQGLKCSELCRLIAYRGFITAEAHDGAFADPDGADAVCRAAALAAGLVDPDNFRAALSTGDGSLLERFADKLGDSTPYVLPGGKKFAKSFADLITHGPEDVGISVTQFSDPLLYAYVATNTDPDGNSHSFDQHCDGWQSADKTASGHTGLNAVAPDDPDLATWRSAGWWLSNTTLSCDTAAFHLYCLE
jgi:hypothetical protein